MRDLPSGKELNTVRCKAKVIKVKVIKVKKLNIVHCEAKIIKVKVMLKYRSNDSFLLTKKLSHPMCTL